jgi:hypothetical protein
MNQKRSARLGKIAGLEIRVAPSAPIAAVSIAAAIAFLLYKVRRWRPWAAATAGILATLIHYLSELWHQVGHAGAAQQTGFPMQGMTYVGPLGISDYPQDEGLLPAEMHIQRALGGPIFSFLLALVAGIVALLLRPLGGWPLSMAVFTFIDNLFVYTIGALLPLGFTDGASIATWWDQRRGSRRLRVR